MKDAFDEIISGLGSIGRELEKTPAAVRRKAVEIRIRIGKQLVVEYDGGRYVVSQKKTEKKDIDSCVDILCGYSVHSHGRELSEGYITLRGGHRAGFCGSAVMKDGEIGNIKNIAGINIRIAREYLGCAEKIVSCADVFAESFKGLIISGKPLSGKTTMLRDLARIIGAEHKVCIVDERSEIAAVHDGVPQNSVGSNTDVLDGYPKRIGIGIALKVMSPEYIICDEITDDREITESLTNGGVKTVFTYHCGSMSDALKSPAVKNLAESGVISCVVQLSVGKQIGEIEACTEVKSNGQFVTRCIGSADRNCGRNLFFG